ncbi:MAG: hypothetical protein ACREMO_09665 [Gemmatimonadales bacterium]
MTLPQHRLWLLVLGLTACGAPAKEPVALPASPPTETVIGQAALAALAAAPWDEDPTGWGTLCTAQAPCDTIVVEPRIVALPAQAPAFFVPERRDLAATLDGYALSLSQLPGRQTRIGSWQACTARRDRPSWGKGRLACAALGVAGLETARPDAMTFALLTMTPVKGLSWPRVRVTRPNNVWRGRVVSNASE